MDNIGSATNSPNWPEKRLTIPPCFSDIYGCDRKKSHSSARKLFYTHTDLKLDTDIHGGKIKNWYCFKMTSKVSHFQQWTFNNHFRIVHYKMHLWIPSYTYVKMAVLFVVMSDKRFWHIRCVCCLHEDALMMAAASNFETLAPLNS